MASTVAAGSAVMRPEDDPGWASYAETVLAFHLPGLPRVDLARPIGAAALATFRRAGLPGTFGLLTPENPRGRTVSIAENDARWARFLGGAGRDAVRVDGWDPAGTRCERGVALPWPRAEVVALAVAWEQSAIYWYDGAEVWVIGALTQSVPWPLGRAR
ncbi:MAG: DUF3293 domain-containing protein [Thermoleophilia bacterium]